MRNTSLCCCFFSRFLAQDGCPGPQALGRQACTLTERLELRGCNLRVDTSAQAAVGGGNNVFAAHQVREALDAVGNQLRVLHDVGGVGDDAGDQDLALGRRTVFPDAPFVFVAHIGRLEGDHSGIDLQHRIEDVGKADVRGVRAVPGAPAHVQADSLRRQPAQRVVGCLDTQRDEREVVLQARFRVDLVLGLGQGRVVDLQDEPGVEDRLVFLAHGIRRRIEVLLNSGSGYCCSDDLVCNLVTSWTPNLISS